MNQHQPKNEKMKANIICKHTCVCVDSQKKKKYKHKHGVRTTGDLTYNNIRHTCSHI